MLSLNLNHRSNGGTIVSEQGEYAVTQQLDNPATMSVDGVGNPAGYLGNSLSRLRVAQGLIDTCAAEQIGEYNGGVNTQSGLILFLEPVHSLGHNPP